MQGARIAANPRFYRFCGGPGQQRLRSGRLQPVFRATAQLSDHPCFRSWARDHVALAFQIAAVPLIGLHAAVNREHDTQHQADHIHERRSGRRCRIHRRHRERRRHQAGLTGSAGGECVHAPDICRSVPKALEPECKHLASPESTNICRLLRNGTILSMPF